MSLRYSVGTLIIGIIFAGTSVPTEVSVAAAASYDDPNGFGVAMGNDQSIIYEPFINKLYHYDNLSSCELSCEIRCQKTNVVYNDQTERLLFICRRRKVPLVSKTLSDFSRKALITTGLMAACATLVTLCWFCSSWCYYGKPNRKRHNSTDTETELNCDGFKESLLHRLDDQSSPSSSSLSPAKRTTTPATMIEFSEVQKSPSQSTNIKKMPIIVV